MIDFQQYPLAWMKSSADDCWSAALHFHHARHDPSLKTTFQEKARKNRKKERGRKEGKRAALCWKQLWMIGKWSRIHRYPGWGTTSQTCHLTKSKRLSTRLDKLLVPFHYPDVRRNDNHGIEIGRDCLLERQLLPSCPSAPRNVSLIIPHARRIFSCFTLNTS